jgi:hypothetical protein
VESLENRWLPSQVTFLQFTEVDPTAENFIYSHTGTNASFTTISGGAPVFVNFDTSIVQGLPAPQFAHLFLSSTTTSAVTAGPSSSLVQHFPTATNTMQFTLDTPVNGHSNLLSVTYSDILIGPANSQSANLEANTLSVPPDTVTFSSDFIDFSNATARDFALSFGSITPNLTLDTDGSGFFAPFTDSGSGTFDANFTPIAMIQGQKFQDTSDLGMRVPGDPGLAGWTIDLINPSTNQVLQTTVTDSQGNYSFTGLAVGTYRVREELKPGWVHTTPNPPDITITAGADVTGVDFGNFHPAQISGEKFLDSNKNGIKDNGELGLPNWTIQLINANTGAVIATTTTDAHGNYSFNNLIPGNYRVREVQQPMFQQTTANPADINLAFAATVTGVNFGNAMTGPISKLQLVSPNFTGLTDPDLVTEAGFVIGVYETLLNRGPDQAGLVTWVQALQAGFTPQQVVTMIWNSPEHFGLEVNQFYMKFLNRPADAAGRASFVNALLAGTPENAVELAILSSAEFSALHSSNANFVAALYQDVLGRAPDTAGMAFWQNALATGTTRTAAAMAFLNSVEANVRLINQDYALFLKRSPDQAGELAWLALAQTSQGFTEQLAVGLLSSDEFFARFQPG